MSHPQNFIISVWVVRQKKNFLILHRQTLRVYKIFRTVYRAQKLFDDHMQRRREEKEAATTSERTSFEKRADLLLGCDCFRKWGHNNWFKIWLPHTLPPQASGAMCALSKNVVQTAILNLHLPSDESQCNWLKIEAKATICRSSEHFAAVNRRWTTTWGQSKRRYNITELICSAPKMLQKTCISCRPASLHMSVHVCVFVPANVNK